MVGRFTESTFSPSGMNTAISLALWIPLPEQELFGYRAGLNTDLPTGSFAGKALLKCWVSGFDSPSFIWPMLRLMQPEVPEPPTYAAVIKALYAGVTGDAVELKKTKFRFPWTRAVGVTSGSFILLMPGSVLLSMSSGVPNCPSGPLLFRVADTNRPPTSTGTYTNSFPQASLLYLSGSYPSG